MTPYEIGQGLLAIAELALPDPPDRAYVSVGSRQTVVYPGCEQLAVRLNSVTFSASGVANTPRLICAGFNRLSVCVELARCHPTPPTTQSPANVTDLEASFQRIADDGLALYLAYDLGDLETLVGCTVVSAPQLVWESPRGGMVVASVCFTLDFTPSTLGS